MKFKIDEARLSGASKAFLKFDRQRRNSQSNKEYERNLSGVKRVYPVIPRSGQREKERFRKERYNTKMGKAIANAERKAAQAPLDLWAPERRIKDWKNPRLHREGYKIKLDEARLSGASRAYHKLRTIRRLKTKKVKENQKSLQLSRKEFKVWKVVPKSEVRQKERLEKETNDRLSDLPWKNSRLHKEERKIETEVILKRFKKKKSWKRPQEKHVVEKKKSKSPYKRMRIQDLEERRSELRKLINRCVRPLNEKTTEIGRIDKRQYINTAKQRFKTVPLTSNKNPLANSENPGAEERIKQHQARIDKAPKEKKRSFKPLKKTPNQRKKPDRPKAKVTPGKFTTNQKQVLRNNRKYRVDPSNKSAGVYRSAYVSRVKKDRVTVRKRKRGLPTTGVKLIRIKKGEADFNRKKGQSKRKFTESYIISFKNNEKT